MFECFKRAVRQELCFLLRRKRKWYVLDSPKNHLYCGTVHIIPMRTTSSTWCLNTWRIEHVPLYAGGRSWHDVYKMGATQLPRDEIPSYAPRLQSVIFGNKGLERDHFICYSYHSKEDSFIDEGFVHVFCR